MADANPTTPAPLPPGTGPGPIGVLGGTDRSYSVDIMVCAASTAAIGLVFVALRFYTRWFIMQVLNWEDWLLLASQVSPRETPKAYHRQCMALDSGVSVCLPALPRIDLFRRHVCRFHPTYGPSSGLKNAFE